MAGSYHHVVMSSEDHKDELGDIPVGSLLDPERVLGMLDCHHRDVYEAIEEMYGMIWWLARNFSAETGYMADEFELVEAARTQYREGLAESPTPRFKENSNG